MIAYQKYLLGFESNTSKMSKILSIGSYKCIQISLQTHIIESSWNQWKRLDSHQILIRRQNQ